MTDSRDASDALPPWEAFALMERLTREDDGAALRPLLRSQIAAGALDWGTAQPCVDAAMEAGNGAALAAWLSEALAVIEDGSTGFQFWLAALRMQALMSRKPAVLLAFIDHFGPQWATETATQARQLLGATLSTQEQIDRADASLAESCRLAGLAVASREGDSIRQALPPAVSGDADAAAPDGARGPGRL
jgi:hypothetical protein